MGTAARVWYRTEEKGQELRKWGGGGGRVCIFWRLPSFPTGLAGGGGAMFVTFGSSPTIHSDWPGVLRYEKEQVKHVSDGLVSGSFPVSVVWSFKWVRVNTVIFNNYNIFNFNVMDCISISWTSYPPHQSIWLQLKGLRCDSKNKFLKRWTFFSISTHNIFEWK